MIDKIGYCCYIVISSFSISYYYLIKKHYKFTELNKTIPCYSNISTSKVN